MIKLSYQLGLVGAILLMVAGFTGHITSNVGGLISLALAAAYADTLLTINKEDEGENQ